MLQFCNCFALLRLMKFQHLLASCLLVTGSLNAHGLGFFTNPNEAAAYALVKDSLVLVFFTGSDWSPLTHELDVKVWDDAAFAAHLNDTHALLNADYPQRTKLTTKQRENLRALAERHRITHFPTILALTPELAEVGRHEYRGESSAQVMEKLKEWEARKDAPNVSAPATLPAAVLSSAQAAPPSFTDLDVGDMLPDLAFINSEGKHLRLHDFHGRALLFTFIFTRCPLPEYCPLLGQKFAAIQKTLSADSAGPKNWHMLSLTIDPKNDTPEALDKYAAMLKADPECWSFATGDLATISRLALGLGADFWADKDGFITHHLRSVLVGADGRIRRIHTDNEWYPEEMAAEMRESLRSNSPGH